MQGNYIDGFVLPVPRKNLAKYKKAALMAAKIWREHGALDYIESIQDDVPEGKTTSFPKSVKLKSDEVVFFSWITYKSKAHRDRVTKAVMKDPRLEKMGPEFMPFDAKRMIYGGFKTFVKKTPKK